MMEEEGYVSGSCPRPLHSGLMELRIHKPPGDMPSWCLFLSLLDHAPNSLPKWLELLLVPREPLAWVSPPEGEQQFFGGLGATDAGRAKRRGLSLPGLPRWTTEQGQHPHAAVSSPTL